jgi:hypothetical protein
MTDPPKKDPLFDDVEEWRAELDDAWIVRLGIRVAIGFTVILVMLVLMLILNG